MLTAGLHLVEVLVSDKSGNTTRIVKEFKALGFGDEPPVTAGNSPKFEVYVDGGLTKAEPGTAIQVNFTEPVTGVDLTTLYLTKAGTKVSDVRLMGTQGEVNAGQRLYTVYLLPSSKLEPGATYEVTGAGTIQDYNAPPLKLNNGSGMTVSFVVQSAQSVDPVSAGGNKVIRAVALGKRFFMATDKGQVVMAEQKDGKLSVMSTFGVTGSGGGDFLGQDIVGLQIFRRITVNWMPMDLLVVTTSPKTSNYENQNAMWVFNACPGMQTPQLLFGVSTGMGGQGYAPTVGCYDGVIAVGRVTGSIQLVDIATGISNWNKDISAVISVAGNNTRAIIQPFWLADPDYTWDNSQSGASHWGVAMTPSQKTMDGKATWQVVVGYSHAMAQYQGTRLTGMPIFRLPYDVGTYKVIPPYIADPVSKYISTQQNAPPAHVYVRPGELLLDNVPMDRGAVRLAAWPRATILEKGQPVTKDLVLGVVTYQVDVKDDKGNAAGKLGNALVLTDVTDTNGKFLGQWPLIAPFGPGVGYEIQRKVPQMDVITGLVAVSVKNLKTNSVSWFVVDFKNPADPKVVYSEPNLSDCGGFSNGMFYGISGTKVIAKKVVDGLTNIEEGECGVPGLKIHVEFEKPKMDKTLYGRLLFGQNDKLVIPARHVRVDLLTTPVQSKYTDENGDVEFSNLSKGDYEYKVVADYRLEDSQGNVVAEAGVYDYKLPSSGSNKFPDINKLTNGAKLHRAGSNLMPEPTEKIRYYGNQCYLSRRVVVENSEKKRFSGPFNILMVYDQAMQTILKANPAYIPSKRLYIGWVAVDDNSDSYFNEMTVNNNIYKYLRISGQYNDSPDEFYDSVVCHEFGHFVDNSLYNNKEGMGFGGDHGNGTADMDWTYVYSEGVATFFQGVVKGQANYPEPSTVYFTATPKYSQKTGCFNPIDSHNNIEGSGPGRELSITRTLWAIHDKAFLLNFNPSLNIWKRMCIVDIPNIYAWWKEAQMEDPSKIGTMQTIMQAEKMLDPQNQPLENPVGCKFNGFPVSIGNQYPFQLYYSQDGTEWKSNIYYRIDYFQTPNALRKIELITTTPTTLPDLQLFLGGEKIGNNPQVQSTSGNIITYNITDPRPGPFILRIHKRSQCGNNYNITFK